MPISIERERIAPCHTLQHAPRAGVGPPDAFPHPSAPGVMQYKRWGIIGATPRTAPRLDKGAWAEDWAIGGKRLLAYIARVINHHIVSMVIDVECTKIQVQPCAVNDIECAHIQIHAVCGVLQTQ